MFNSLKSKIWVLLTSKRTGKFISKYFIKDGFIKTSAGLVKVGQKPSKAISLIFWRLYEREDLHFINKYLPSNRPVIEFGASLGVTTTHICKKIDTNVLVVSVEANPNLYSNLLETKSKNQLDNLEIISAAVDYSGEKQIGFSVDDSTLSSSKTAKNLNTMVETVQLSEIVKKYQFSDYSLVCDIEGAEVELLLLEKDKKVIDGCKLIIIELHPTKYNNKNYTVEELKNLFIKKYTMHVVDSKASTFVFRKANG